MRGDSVWTLKLNRMDNAVAPFVTPCWAICTLTRNDFTIATSVNGPSNTRVPKR